MTIPFASLRVKSYLTSFKGTCVLSAKLMPKFTLLPGWISAGSHLSVTAYFPLEVFLSSGGFGTSAVAVVFCCPSPTFKNSNLHRITHSPLDCSAKDSHLTSNRK